MALFEDDTQVFIVRIWLERREIEDAPPEWRGVIEHISGEERRYVNDLIDLVIFIAAHLEKLGIKVDPFWQNKP